MMPRDPKPGGFRPISELRDRLNSVHALVDDVRDEPFPRLQFPVASIVVAILPLAIAFAAIRQASRLDGAGYLLCFAFQIALTIGAVAWSLRFAEDDSELARIFHSELVVVGVVISLAGLCFLQH